MDECTAKRIRAKAISIAKGMGYKNEAEDLAHDLIITWHNKLDKGGEVHQTIAHGLIDELRKQSGRFKNSRKRKNEDSFIQHQDLIERNSLGVELIDIQNILKIAKLSKEERAVFILYFKWELNLKEIGECFGYSESRAAQKLKSASEKLSI